MSWEGGLFVDTALPFGLRSAPKIFTAVADAVQWILQQEGVRFVIHFLDDFLLVGAPESGECAFALSVLFRVFARLGLPVALEKLAGPATCLVFLGFEIDSLLLELRLPRSKLDELRSLVSWWLDRRSCRRVELESLVGTLAQSFVRVRPFCVAYFSCFLGSGNPSTGFG